MPRSSSLRVLVAHTHQNPICSNPLLVTALLTVVGSQLSSSPMSCNPTNPGPIGPCPGICVWLTGPRDPWEIMSSTKSATHGVCPIRSRPVMEFPLTEGHASCRVAHAGSPQECFYFSLKPFDCDADFSLHPLIASVAWHLQEYSFSV